MTFYYFRTYQGEWMCGELISDAEEGFVLRKPRVLVYHPNPQNPGQFALQLMPFDMLNPDGDVQFHPECAMAHVPNPPDELEKKYLESTTNLIMAKAH